MAELLRTFAELVLCQCNKSIKFISSRMEYFQHTSSTFPAKLQLAIYKCRYILTNRVLEQIEGHRHDEEDNIRKL
jgi:hypothetical protein